MSRKAFHNILNGMGYNRNLKLQLVVKKCSFEWKVLLINCSFFYNESKEQILNMSCCTNKDKLTISLIILTVWMVQTWRSTLIHSFTSSLSLLLLRLVFSHNGSDATNPMQIMFSVLRGSRPDTGLDSLPASIPGRETLINLMTCGWTANPDERPSFLSKWQNVHL